MKSLSDFTLLEQKNFGVQEGAIYTLDNKKYMLKSMDFNSTIAELVGAKIARLIAGDSAPEVFLVKGENGEVLTASKYIDNFLTVIEYIGKYNIPLECLPHGCVIRQDGSIEYLLSYIVNSLSLTH